MDYGTPFDNTTSVTWSVLLPAGQNNASFDLPASVPGDTTFGLALWEFTISMVALSVPDPIVTPLNGLFSIRDTDEIGDTVRYVIAVRDGSIVSTHDRVRSPRGAIRVFLRVDVPNDDFDVQCTWTVKYAKHQTTPTEPAQIDD